MSEIQFMDKEEAKKLHARMLFRSMLLDVPNILVRHEEIVWIKYEMRMLDEL
jgi:hypothetical protein